MYVYIYIYIAIEVQYEGARTAHMLGYRGAETAEETYSTATNNNTL